MVAHILRNRVYLGEMVQCKYKTVSYKIHKRVKNSKENWIIVKGTHEALVSYNDFDKVQKTLDSRGWKCNHDGTISTFAGKVKCGDCKCAMHKNTSGFIRKDGSRVVHYYCSTYTRKSHDLCTRQGIKYEVLEDLVLKAIQNQSKLVLEQEKLIKKIYAENRKEEMKADYK